MLETAELGRKLGKEEYEAQVRELRFELLKAQNQLRGTPVPVILVITGNDRPGCNEVLNRLHEWLDARYLNVHAPDVETDEERARPYFWRIWRMLPPRGEIGIFLGGRYAGLFDREVARRDEKDKKKKRKKRKDSAEALDLETEMRFERMLVDDGAILLKLFLHLPHRAYRKRLKKSARGGEKGFLLSKEDRDQYESFHRAREAVSKLLRRTSTGFAPWHVIESTDPRYRDITIARMLLEQLPRTLPELENAEAAEPVEAPPAATQERVSVLDTVDLSETIDRDAYKSALAEEQARMHRLSRRARRKGIPAVIVFQGWDAAGKGGAIRRLIAPMDARNYRVHSIAAPSEEERKYHYLWRFWRRIPARGRIAIFDRSWYGRVLVERVEGFARPEEWMRAYEEINDFEEQLHAFGVRVVKFWIHIDADEQLRRFQEREKTPHKKHKITQEDWRNREKWDAYRLAVDEMIGRTSTEFAPWTIVAGNDKRLARLQVLRTVNKALK
jgi:polyphosphate:AMP phosphotransferase